MEMGQRIKKIRNGLGLTQSGLAAKVNMSRSYLADVENDRYNPSISTLEKIAEALNVSVDRLTGRSVSSIIEDRLEETKITLEDIANKAKVPLHWLQNLDTFVPGQLGDYEIGYEWITRVAKVLGLPDSILRAALARQEPPIYDGPSDARSLKEIFANEDFGENTSGKINSLTPKDERDIARDLERMLSSLESQEALAFDGEPLDDETKELMRISLENSMRLAKQLAKKKFTPKKYK